jgi:hypothetical protein
MVMLQTLYQSSPGKSTLPFRDAVSRISLRNILTSRLGYRNSFTGELNADECRCSEEVTPNLNEIAARITDEDTEKRFAEKRIVSRRR